MWYDQLQPPGRVLRMKKKTVCRLYALSWFLIGGWLFYKGIQLLFYPVTAPMGVSLFGHTIDPTQLNLLLIALALVVSRLKEPLLARAAKRNRDRIEELEEPIAIKRMFAPAYLVLIGLMMCLGLAMSFFNVPSLIRGPIDIAIGGALIGGARYYLKRAPAPKVDEGN